MRAVPRLCIKLYPGIRLTTEENHGKTSVGVAETRLTEGSWARFVWATWWPFHGRLGGRFTGDLDRPAGRHHLERRIVSISTGRWSELSAEQTVRFTGVTRFLVKTMSKASGIADGL